MKKILFVCTGNTCRSPMCAALLNAKDNDMYAFSAGLYADGSPISKNAIAALHELGVTDTKENHYSAHISHTVTQEDIVSADTVYGVTPAHAAQLRALFPAYAEKIFALPIPIFDPYGSDLDGYEQCLMDIDRAFVLLFPSAERTDSCDRKDMP